MEKIMVIYVVINVDDLDVKKYTILWYPIY